jgi:hypothetical protein
MTRTDPKLTTAGDAVRAPDELGITDLDGDWISATRLAHGVARVRTRRTEAALLVRAYGGGEPHPGDWGEAEAEGVYAVRIGNGYAFIATFDGEVTSTELHTNQVYGVMAVHAFHRFVDGSGRRDYFSREFYVPAASTRSGRGSEANGSVDRFPDALLEGEEALTEATGTFTVLDAANANISAMECEVTDGALTVRAFGPGTDGQPVDWGTAAADVFADAARPDGPPAFLTTFDLADRQVRVQGRNYNGILVVAQYTRFTDGSGRADFYSRDCFHA